jgi:hypothetical protein
MITGKFDIMKIKLNENSNLIFKKLAGTICFMGIIYQSFSQCPDREYFFSAETDLPWASCYVYHSGGSKTKIPFLPAIYENQSPCGTAFFTKDIELDLKIIFAGDGKVLAPDFNPYKNIDASGKAVMICNNFTDSLNRIKDELSIADCINQAVKHGAKAVIIADLKQDPNNYRFSKEQVNEEIPVIVIDRKGAYKILQSAGRNPEKLFNEWKSTGNFISDELICKIKIVMKGRFNHLTKSNFTYYYPDGSFDIKNIEDLSEENDRAVDFLIGLYKDMDLKWDKTTTVFFPGFDIKSFYTLHCGRGLANEKGVFVVLDTSRKEFKLIVHENSHKLFYSNLGGNSSFISEGIGMYSEAEATNKNANHMTTLKFLKERKLFPLENMMNFDIGRIPEETVIGYPSSGSFIGFIIDNYGIGAFKKLYMHKDKTTRWSNVYGKSLKELETEWHNWLLSEFQ